MQPNTFMRPHQLLAVPVVAALGVAIAQLEVGGRSPALPGTTLLAIAAAAAVSVVTSSNARWAAGAFIAAVTSFVGFTITTAPPGDRGDVFYYEALADVARLFDDLDQNDLGVSSVLPDLLIWQLSPATGRWVLPDLLIAALSVCMLLAAAAAGVLSTRAVSSDSDRPAADDAGIGSLLRARRPQRAGLGVLAVLMTAIPTVYVSNYVEVYPFAIIAGLLAVGTAVAWLRGAAAWHVTAAALALAVLAHGLYLLIPIGVAIVVVAERRWRDGVPVLAAMSTVVAIVLVGLWWSPSHQVVSGNAGGGADGQLLASIGSRGWFEGVVWALLPGAGAAIALVVTSGRDVLARGRHELVFAGLAVAFWLLWGFDFGLPADIDLIATGAVLVIPATIAAIDSLVSSDRRAPAVLAVTAVLVAVSVGTILFSASDVPDGCKHEAVANRELVSQGQCPMLPG